MSSLLIPSHFRVGWVSWIVILLVLILTIWHRILAYHRIIGILLISHHGVLVYWIVSDWIVHWICAHHRIITHHRIVHRVEHRIPLMSWLVSLSSVLIELIVSIRSKFVVGVLEPWIIPSLVHVIVISVLVSTSHRIVVVWPHRILAHSWIIVVLILIVSLVVFVLIMRLALFVWAIIRLLLHKVSLWLEPLTHCRNIKRLLLFKWFQ